MKVGSRVRTLSGPYAFQEGHSSVGSEGVILVITATKLAKVRFDRQTRNGVSHPTQENYCALNLLEEIDA